LCAQRLHRSLSATFNDRMSIGVSSPKSPRLAVPQIRARRGKEKIVGLTAHSAPMATLLDLFVDMMLVGDSLGMVVHGLPTTVGVTLDMMVLHGCAVMRGSSRALVVVDLPFGSYAGSPQQAHASAVRVMRETGCAAIKLEAAGGVAETIAFLVRRGIPVVGHVGLRPQAANLDGGFKAKGRSTGAGRRTRRSARGRSARRVRDGRSRVSGELAEEITRTVSIPTIGIGASPGCDGQILVTDVDRISFDRLGNEVPHLAVAAHEFRRPVEHADHVVRSGTFSGARRNVQLCVGSSGAADMSESIRQLRISRLGQGGRAP
jgi:3-methyl-2-oxobutanoate hydroxymethyltransferase